MAARRGRWWWWWGASSAPPDLDEVVAPARDEAHGLQGRAGRRGCREDRAGREGGGPRDRVAADLVRVEPLDGPAVVGLARQDAHPAIGGRASQAEAVLHRAPCDRVDGALVLAALVHLPPLARRVLLPHEDLTVVPRRSRGRRNRRLWAGTRARPQPLPGKQPLPSEGPPLGPRGGGSPEQAGGLLEWWVAARPAASEAISTVLRARARRQQGAELRVRPRHLPHRPVVPAIAEGRRGQPRAASRRCGARLEALYTRSACPAHTHCMCALCTIRLAHPFRSATCLRSPPSMTS